MLTWHDWNDGKPFGCLMPTNDLSKAPYGSYEVQEDNSVSWQTDISRGVCDSIPDAKTAVERKMLCYPIKGDEPCAGQYTEVPYKFGKVYTVRRLRTLIKRGELDGHGHPIKDNKMDGECVIWPSTVAAIPEDADHIQWYSKREEK